MEQKIWKSDSFFRELGLLITERRIRSVLLVCGASFRAQRLYNELCRFLEESAVRRTEFSDFCPNPEYESVVKGIEVLRENQCDFIIVAGGGSAMDVAKCMKLFSNMDPEKNYLEQEITKNDLPLLAIPTTAGTGSEATRFAVIYYEGKKQSVSHESALPQYALLDPSLLDTLPMYQRRATMLDAFCHAVESCWSVNSTDVSRRYSAKALEILLRSMDAYLANDPAGNAQMLLAANLAGKAINITQTTAGHAMCYKLTSLYGLAHGHAAALCVAALWRYMAEHTEDCCDMRGAEHLERVLDELADIMGCASAPESADRFQAILKKLEITAPRLRDEGELTQLVQSVNPVRLKNNPVPLSEKTLEGLYRQILTVD